MRVITCQQLNICKLLIIRSKFSIMKTYPEEYEAYEIFKQENDLSKYELSTNQLETIFAKIRNYNSWVTHHHFSHNLLSIFILCFLLFIDLFFLTYLCTQKWDNLLLAIIVLSFLRGFFTLSIQYFTLHEGLCHDRFILGIGKLPKIGKRVLNIISRIYFCDPEYFVPTHNAHHKYTSTKKDGAYGQFISPKRLLIAMIPLTFPFQFCDFKTHRDTRDSYKKFYGDLVGITIQGLICTLINFSQEAYWPGLLYIFLASQLNFWWVTIIGYLEHIFMIDNEIYGGRSNGNNLLGYFITGGPLGQPYHFSHHIGPSLPWYFQKSLNKDLKKIFNKDQKNYFITKSSLELLRIFFGSIIKSIYYSNLVKNQNPSKEVHLN